MTGTILFWTCLALAAFAFALAVQMRVMVALVLRKALAAKYGGEANGSEYRDAVLQAANDAPESTEAQHIIDTYPRPLSHIRLARLVCLVAPPALFVILLAGRFVLGVI